MATVVIKGKKVTSKKKTTKKKAAPKSPQKTPTSAGVGKTGGKQPKTPTANKPKTSPGSSTTGTKKMTQLSAAFKVLQENGTEMNCKAMVEDMMEKGYWKPAKGGLTPQNTLNAGIGTEIRKKGKDARFKKTAPGKYIANPDYKG